MTHKPKMTGLVNPPKAHSSLTSPASNLFLPIPQDTKMQTQAKPWLKGSFEELQITFSS